MPKKVAFFFAMDSQIKICLPIAEAFKKKGWEAEFYQVPTEGSYLTTREHASELGMSHFKRIELEIFFQQNKAFEYGVLIGLLSGYQNYLFTKYYSIHLKGNPRKWRPITVSGVFGIEILKRKKGYALRSAFDIVYVTAEIDIKLSKKRYPMLPLDNLKATGLPFLDSIYKKRNRLKESKSGFTVLYACQNLFPATQTERNYLVQKLANWCRQHPKDRLLFKPRHQKNQSSVHPVIYHEEDSIREVLGDKIPNNFTLTYSPINELLKESDLCLTISSTASFEAVALGVPIGYLRDEVIRNPNYGYWYLEDSECLYNFEDLDSKKIPTASSDWLNTHFKCNGRNTEDLLAEIFLLREKQEKTQRPLPQRKKELWILDYTIAVHKHLLLKILSVPDLPQSLRSIIHNSLHNLKGFTRLHKKT